MDRFASLVPPSLFIALGIFFPLYPLYLPRRGEGRSEDSLQTRSLRTDACCTARPEAVLSTFQTFVGRTGVFSPSASTFLRKINMYSNYEFNYALYELHYIPLLFLRNSTIHLDSNVNKVNKVILKLKV